MEQLTSSMRPRADRGAGGTGRNQVSRVATMLAAAKSERAPMLITHGSVHMLISTGERTCCRISVYTCRACHWQWHTALASSKSNMISKIRYEILMSLLPCHRYSLLPEPQARPQAKATHARTMVQPCKDENNTQLTLGSNSELANKGKKAHYWERHQQAETTMPRGSN